MFCVVVSPEYVHAQTNGSSVKTRLPLLNCGFAVKETLAKNGMISKVKSRAKNAIGGHLICAPLYAILLYRALLHAMRR